MRKISFKHLYLSNYEKIFCQFYLFTLRGTLMKNPFSSKISYFFAFRSLAEKTKQKFSIIIYNKTSNAELSEQRIPQVLCTINCCSFCFCEKYFRKFRIVFAFSCLIHFCEKMRNSMHGTRIQIFAFFAKLFVR